MLTGRTRHRIMTRPFRKALLVLECEVDETVVENFGGYVGCEHVKRWRDATLQDYVELQQKDTRQ